MMNSYGTIRCVILVAILAMIAGCAGVWMSPDEFQKYLNDPKAPRIVVQVCLPDKTVHFDEIKIDVTDMPIRLTFPDRDRILADAAKGHLLKTSDLPREYQTMRQWKKPLGATDYPDTDLIGEDVYDKRGVRSEASAEAKLFGATKQGQPVFYEFTRAQSGDLLALNFRLDVPMGDGTMEWHTYWLKPPQNIPKDGYTDWMDPVSEEGPEQVRAKFPTGLLVLNDKPIPIYPVRQGAPKVRYTLVSFDEYFAADREHWRAVNAAWAQYLFENRPASLEMPFYLVDQKAGEIPRC